MAYPIPLSEKTIQKQLTEAGLGGIRSDYLHRFFLAAANLYGQISVRDLWDQYKEQKSRDALAPSFHRKDFEVFSGIVRRENLPYRIYELDEVCRDKTGGEADRVLILNSLMGRGNQRFRISHHLMEHLPECSYYNSSDFMSFADDQKESAQEKNLRLFVENLRADEKTLPGKDASERVSDHVGKKLKEFSFLSVSESEKAEQLRQRADGKAAAEKELNEYLEERKGPESDKILRDFSFNVRTGIVEFAEAVGLVLAELQEAGVKLSDGERKGLIRLLAADYASMHCYALKGWTPKDLASVESREKAADIRALY